ncbi:hypothetical protein Aasi_0273 [Candidatus Amoebophilus asiaticus 5a2]|uniref:Uncharacterized protein n=1 Tax=Amoebophilus asiaticus (strain 5a2) TaxID=452471 RepID=B3ER60_AMOA5|nr:hypothetical protein Aasi_0273 [Candidatus Amoebophilus asiaticus 5a2]
MIKVWGEQTNLPATQETVELDEFAYVCRLKKITVGYGLLLIGLVNGFSRMCVEDDQAKQDQDYRKFIPKHIYKASQRHTLLRGITV